MFLQYQHLLTEWYDDDENIFPMFVEVLHLPAKYL